MNDVDFKMAVVERLGRIEEQLKPLTDFDKRLRGLEKFKYLVASVATVAGATVGTIIEHLGAFASAIVAMTPKH